MFLTLCSPHVFESVRKPVADMVADRARDTDAAGCGQALQPCGDVDALAEDVVAVGDHVAEVDPDAKAQAALLGEIQIALGHRVLDFAGTAHRVNDAGKFRQHAIAGGLDDTPVMLADFRINELDEMRLDAFVRSFLIRTHQARVAYYIGGEDRGKAAGSSLGGHGSDGAISRAEFNLIPAETR